MSLLDDLEKYIPFNEQEERDKELILQYMKRNPGCFYREDTVAHMTASGWVVNKDRTKVLMIYHNLYDSWAWTGGHADGDEDLLNVAIKECREETGVTSVVPVTTDIFSVEVLNVEGHVKRGKYLSSHLHLNVTYLLEADENDTLHICEAENSGVKWFGLDEALKASSEPWFVDHIYSKLNNKLKNG